jgi:hypothetical protein
VEYFLHAIKYEAQSDRAKESIRQEDRIKPLLIRYRYLRYFLKTSLISLFAAFMIFISSYGSVPALEYKLL